MTTQAKARPARLRAAVVIAGGAAFLAACSSGTSSSSSGTPTPHTTSPTMTHSASPSMTATASAATCKHVASLTTSLEHLNHLQLNASSSKQIRTDLTNVQTQLTALKAEPNSAVSAQVSSLSTSLIQVEKAGNHLSANPTAAQIQAIVTALSGLRSSSRATVAHLKAICPNA